MNVYKAENFDFLLFYLRNYARWILLSLNYVKHHLHLLQNHENIS